MLSFFKNSVYCLTLILSSMAWSKPTWTLSCTNKGASNPAQITVDLDNVFLGGEKETNITYNSQKTNGYVSVVNGHDNSFHGLKKITTYFGENLSVHATLSPSFGRGDSSTSVEGEGSGTLYRYGHQVLSEMNCQILSTCTSDPRVCANM